MVCLGQSGRKWVVKNGRACEAGSLCHHSTGNRCQPTRGIDQENLGSSAILIHKIPILRIFGEFWRLKPLFQPNSKIVDGGLPKNSMFLPSFHTIFPAIWISFSDNYGKSQFFNGKTHYKWWCSIVMFVYQRVYHVTIRNTFPIHHPRMLAARSSRVSRLQRLTRLMRIAALLPRITGLLQRGNRQLGPDLSKKKEGIAMRPKKDSNDSNVGWGIRDLCEVWWKF